MAKGTQKKENPLLSKNIPQPPEQINSTATEEPDNTTTLQDSSTLLEPEEKATIELSLYLRPSQDDKLEDLKREYKRRTYKKITSNQVMRLLIDKATINDLL